MFPDKIFHTPSIALYRFKALECQIKMEKCIALIDDNGDHPRLCYVFDVSDTKASQYRSRPVQLWEMRQEHREQVLEHLSSTYEDGADNGFVLIFSLTTAKVCSNI